MAAKGEQEFWRPLDDDAPFRAVAVLGGHHFRGGIERDLGASRALLAERVEFHAAFEREGEQRGFRGIAEGTPTAVLIVGRDELGVVAERDGLEHCAEMRVGVGNFAARLQQLALGRVTGAGDLDVASAGQPERGHGHLVLGQGAGLVRADDARGAERLDCGEAAHDGAAASHALHADGERDRHRHGKSLGDHGDHLADGDHEHIREGHPTQQADGEHHAHERDGRDDEVSPEMRDAEFERRVGILGGGGELRDLADLGGEAGGDDDSLAASRGDVRAGIDDVEPFCQRSVGGERFGVLGDRERFAGERGLGGLERGGFQQPRIRPDGVARGEEDDIARHEVAGLDDLLPATAQDAHL